MIKTLANLLKLDKEKFVVPKGVQNRIFTSSPRLFLIKKPDIPKRSGIAGKVFTYYRVNAPVLLTGRRHQRCLTCFFLFISSTGR